MKFEKIKNTMIAMALFVSGHASAQDQGSSGSENDNVKAKTEQVVQPVKIDSLEATEDTSAILAWDKTASGQEMIAAYQEVMSEYGVKQNLNAEDMLYLRKLSGMDLRIGAFATELKQNYQMTPIDLIKMKPDSICEKSAEATKRFLLDGLKGRCYWSVKRTDLIAFPLAYVEGRYAWEAISWYDKNPNFAHIVIDHKDTDKLVEGTTVVMDPGLSDATKAAHTYKIIAGNKKKVFTDEKTGKSCEYTIAQQRCDGETNTNTSGLKKGIPYGPKSHAFIPKTAELSEYTCVKILYNKAKQTNRKVEQVRPKQLWEVYLSTVNDSYSLHQEQLKYAEKEFPTCVKNQTIEGVDSVKFNRATNLSTKPPITKKKVPSGRSARRGARAR